MKTKLVVRRILDGMIVFACFYAIVMMIVIIYGSIKYFAEVFLQLQGNYYGKLFWVGLIASILYSCGHWVIDFMQYLVKTIKGGK